MEVVNHDFTYRHWEVRVMDEKYYKGKHNYVYHKFRYSFISGGDTITSGGTMFISVEIAFEAGKRAIDRMCKAKTINKPNKSFKGNKNMAIKKNRVSDGGKGGEKKPVVREKVDRTKRDTANTAGATADKQRREVPTTKEESKGKAKKAPKIDKPSGEGVDVPKKEINNTTNDKKGNTAMANVTEVVLSKALKALNVKLGHKTNAHVKALGLLDEKKTQIDEAKAKIFTVVSKAVFGGQMYLQGIRKYDKSGDPLKDLCGVEKGVKTIASDVARLEKSLDGLTKKEATAKADLKGIQDDVKAQIKEDKSSKPK